MRWLAFLMRLWMHSNISASRSQMITNTVWTVGSSLQFTQSRGFEHCAMIHFCSCSTWPRDSVVMRKSSSSSCWTTRTALYIQEHPSFFVHSAEASIAVSSMGPLDGALDVGWEKLSKRRSPMTGSVAGSLEAITGSREKVGRDGVNGRGRFLAVAPLRQSCVVGHPRDAPEG